MPYFVGITGASGVVIGHKLASYLSEKEKVFLCPTKTALKIGKLEGVSFSNLSPNTILVDEDNFFTPVASGSFRLRACIISPCSMGALARIANGISSNLIERAADIALKERWKLILVPREAPLNSIHLENMLKLSRAGATIIPPVLTFYHKPKGIDELVNFVVGKILDNLGIEHNLYQRWMEEDEA